jgi:hypothetical protein
VWTVAELGAFYTEHRSELLAHANRVLKDSAKAEEISIPNFDDQVKAVGL